MEGGEGGLIVEMVACVYIALWFGRYFSLLYINFALMVDENKGNEI